MKKAVLAALSLALAASLLTGCGSGEYMSVSSVGKYDSTIITNSLLQKETSLPNATQSSLPIWRGGSVIEKSSTELSARKRVFYESDVAFLSSAGMNLLRAELSFATLRSPGYPKNAEQVNSSELEQLDELLAWCMEYDVHLCVAMAAPPQEGADIFTDAEALELTAKYWKMLARRYSPISARNLSFCLMSAPEAPSAQELGRVLSVLSSGVWNVSKERVVISDVTNEAEAEQAAQLGIALSYRFVVDGADVAGTGAESRFDAVVLPVRAVSRQYGVGMMIGALGIETDVGMGDTYYEFYGAAAQCLNTNGLGWSLMELRGENGLIAKSGQFLQPGANAVEVETVCSSGTKKLLCDERLYEALTGKAMS